MGSNKNIEVKLIGLDNEHYTTALDSLRKVPRPWPESCPDFYVDIVTGGHARLCGLFSGDFLLYAFCALIHNGNPRVLEIPAMASIAPKMFTLTHCLPALDDFCRLNKCRFISTIAGSDARKRYHENCGYTMQSYNMLREVK